MNLSRLTIGAQSDNHGLSYFKGTIDDIRIYDYAISLSDINELYHEGGW